MHVCAVSEAPLSERFQQIPRVQMSAERQLATWADRHQGSLIACSEYNIECADGLKISSGRGHKAL